MTRIEYVPTVGSDGIVTLRVQAVASRWRRLLAALARR